MSQHQPAIASSSASPAEQQHRAESTTREDHANTKGEAVSAPSSSYLNDVVQPHHDVVVEDLAPRCCAAYGVEVRPDRPCLLFRGLLSPEECATVVADSSRRHDTAPRSLETGERSEFSAEDAALSAGVWLRIREFLPQNLDGGECIGLRKEWHHARYFPGQSVFAHMDQRQTSTEHKEDAAVGSRMSLTIYLDDAFERGEISFVTGVRLDGSYTKEHIRHRPRAGDAVLFYQAVPEFSHCAHPPRGGCKTIMRSDVMYRFETADQADVGGLRVEGGTKLSLSSTTTSTATC